MNDPFSKDDFQRLIAELRFYAAEFRTPAQADLIHRTISALEDFTTERVPSLDHAFGLVESRGKRITAENFDLACRAYQLKYRDEKSRTWAQVEEELDAIHKADLDGDGLKNLVRRNLLQIKTHFFQIDTARVLRELEEDDAG
jgi:hypothetical protein